MNTKKGLIGVIVPVYKVEKYIAECIDSILAQTYTNFRLILVDDGTPDNAGKICDEYAKKDPRITVIHQENAGVTRARARGVEEAEDCEFITFVDGDDTIADDYLRTLLNANSDNIDIVVNYTYTNNITMSIIEYRTRLLTELGIQLAPWGKLFKKGLFDEFTFEIPRSIIIAEDLIMNIRLSFNTEKNVRICNKEIYNYRIRRDSAFHTHTRTDKNEQECYNLKVNSIPEEHKERYMSTTIPPRIKRFWEFWGYKYYVNDMKSSLFYQQLITDIRKYKFNLKTIDYIILNYKNPIIRYIAINIKKIQNIISTITK